MYDGYVAHHYAYMEKVVQDEEPTCFDEPIGSEQWNATMDEEINALDASGTWQLAPLPNEKNAIGCKWVYKIKHNADGLISTYKVCLVVKGYALTYGIDFEETFNPIAKMETMRVVIFMAIGKG